MSQCLPQIISRLIGGKHNASSHFRRLRRLKIFADIEDLEVQHNKPVFSKFHCARAKVLMGRCSPYCPRFSYFFIHAISVSLFVDETSSELRLNYCSEDVVTCTTPQFSLWASYELKLLAGFI